MFCSSSISAKTKTGCLTGLTTNNMGRGKPKPRRSNANKGPEQFNSAMIKRLTTKMLCKYIVGSVDAMTIKYQSILI